jgi:hypothetical protein
MEQKHLGISFSNMILKDGKLVQFTPEHKLSLVEDHDTAKVLMSEVFNNTEFDYRVFIRVTYLSEFGLGEEYDGKAEVEVHIAKTAEYLSKEKLQGIAETYGIEPEEVRPYDIADYGLSATIESVLVEDNKEAIDQQVKLFTERISGYTGLLGFYLDRPQNRIGNNGWDFLDGRIG